MEGAATNIAGEEAADADTATAVADTEAAAAVVTGALGGAAGAGEEEAGDGTTTGKIKPPAKSKRRNRDFECRLHGRSTLMSQSLIFFLERNNTIYLMMIEGALCYDISVSLIQYFMPKSMFCRLSSFLSWLH